jgi:hypothetical protein
MKAGVFLHKSSHKLSDGQKTFSKNSVATNSRVVTPGDGVRQHKTREHTPLGSRGRKKEKSVAGNPLRDSRDSIQLTSSIDSDTFTNSSIDNREAGHT